MADMSLLYYEDEKPKGEIIGVHENAPTSNSPRRTPGLLTLVTAARSAGFDVDLIPFAWPSMNDSATRQTYLAEKLVKGGLPVAISTMSPYLPFSLKLAAEIKRQDPERFIIMGGPGPTSIAAHLLKNYPQVDAVYRGEGEQALPEILQRLRERKGFEGCLGMVWRRDGEVREEAPRPLIYPEEAIISPDFSLVSPREYQMARYFSSRGCPYGCAFCSVKVIWGKKCRYLPVDRIIEDVLSAQRLGYPYVAFDDEIFIMNKKRATEICKRMIAERFALPWGCNGRIDLLDQGLLELMVEAGLKTMATGLESGSEAIAKRHKGGFTIKEAHKKIAMAAKIVPSMVVHYIFGWPDETWEDFEDTVESALRMREEAGILPTIYRMRPIPGSPLYDKYGHDVDLCPDLLHSYEHDSFHFAEDIIRQDPLMGSQYYYFRSPHREKKFEKAMRLSKALSTGKIDLDLTWMRTKSFVRRRVAEASEKRDS